MMKHYCMQLNSYHPAEIPFSQLKGGDSAVIWVANCKSENMRIIIKNQHVLTVSVSFGFSLQEKKPGQLSKPPVTWYCQKFYEK